MEEYYGVKLPAKQGTCKNTKEVANQVETQNHN